MWPQMSKAQREWILRRDSSRCQKFRYLNGVWVQCSQKSVLHVHHIFPKTALMTWFPTSDPHTPYNLLALCGDNHHNGPEGVHPDISTALKDYRRGDKQAYQLTFDARAISIKKGRFYHNTIWDLLFLRRALQNTEAYLKTHPDDPFPVTVKGG